MRLNKKIEYAIATILFIHNYVKSGTNSVTAGQIFDSTDIPKKYLTVILSDLQRYGILKSVRGFKGGYVLAKPLCNISIKDVLYATTRITFRQEDDSDNPYRNYAKRIISELINEYEKILSRNDFETLNKRFEDSLLSKPPMFYI